MANLIMNTSIQQWETYSSSGGLLENNITLAYESPGSLIGSALDLLDERLDTVETGELNGEGTNYVHRLGTGDTNEPVVIVTVTGSGFSPSTDPTRAGLINEDDIDFTINSFDVDFLETHSSITPLASLGFSGSLIVSNGELASGSLTSFSMTALNGASFSITGDLNFSGVSLTSTAATLAWSMDTNPADGAPSLATLQVKVANLVFNDTTEAGIITEVTFDDAYQDMHFALTGTAITFADLKRINSNSNTLENLLKLAVTDAGDTVTLIGNGGTDILGGGAGNDLLDFGEGIDTALFSGARVNYNISGNDTRFTVSDNQGTDGSDTLVNIERLQFSDKKIALDLAPTGNAGQAVLFIGVLAPDLVASPGIVGLILDFVDDGMSMQQLNQLAVDIGLVHDLAGGSSNADVAGMAFENVVGVQATPDMIDMLVGFMDGRSANFTQSEFLTAVANLEVNQVNVDLVGLAQTGIEFAFG